MGQESGQKVTYISQVAIEAYAENVLEAHSVVEPPVPVERIASDLGLIVEYTELGDDVSGILVLDGDNGVIGVNSKHPTVRQRFTIAHEIGHWCLHRDWTDVFIDSEFEPRYRDKKASRGRNPEEIQANKFAAALLIPESFLNACIEEEGIDIGDDEQVEGLADRFEVSVAAMTYRLTNLEFLV
jgi:Zn-dependent peptidase ImmA (M78 family)